MTEQEFLKWWYTEFKFSYTDNLATTENQYATFDVTVQPIPQEAKNYIDENFGGAITFSIAYLKPSSTKGNNNSRRNLANSLANDSPYNRNAYTQTYVYNNATVRVGCDHSGWVFCNDLSGDGSDVLYAADFPASVIRTERILNASIYKTLHQEHEHPSLDPLCANKGGALGRWLWRGETRLFDKSGDSPAPVFWLRYTVIAHLGDNPGFGKLDEEGLSWFKNKGHPLASDIHTIEIDIDDIWYNH